MEQKRPVSLEQIRAFMAASEEIRFEGRDRKQIYQWVREMVIEKQYHLQGKAEKGLLRCYVAKVTGLSRAQVTRLLAIVRKRIFLNVSRQGFDGGVKLESKVIEVAIR
jgi:hypothetical protein